MADYHVYRQSPAGVYSSYKHNAKTRGLTFPISMARFMSYWQQPCYYCGHDIKTAGLDRIDNSKGYTPQNLVPCCQWCNFAKGQISREQYIALCLAVTRKHHPID